LLKKGSRLSITPVTGSEWTVIVAELQRAQSGER
jgi:predicted RNA-binding protein with PUA-like domain